MWLRVNRQHTKAADYQQVHAIEGQLLPGIDQALRLEKPAGVDELPGFEQGHLSVQDAAAQIAAPWLLAGRPDGILRVLDACAAPGGKTCHLLELLGAGADLTAIDNDKERLTSIQQNLARLGMDATVLAADASKPGEWWDGAGFDRILLDAPCSATGVIRRHPDIKQEDIRSLARRQQQMLSALWALVNPGGRLLYVTCSVLAEENEEVVGDFLSTHTDAREDRVLHDYNIRDLMCDKTPGFQVLPGTQGMDGFYFANLEKVSG